MKVDSYSQAIDFLYNQRPAFERQGAMGYKPGLETTMALDNAFGNPHRNYRIIHVAGTNGKGSVSHLIASVLQCQGYKVGIYSSPHFVDFAERIKVNGVNIPHDRVVQFVNECSDKDIAVSPSFFELTTILAFKYFAECGIDFAVVEVGLGGRLDSTNIVTPILSVITNISIDHTQFLGSTLLEIAGEKAGIIKPGIPVVVGNVLHEVKSLFKDRCKELNSPVTFTCSTACLVHKNEAGMLHVNTEKHGHISCQLCGEYQVDNINTALAAIDVLRCSGVVVDESSIVDGMARVCDITSFRGRWTVVQKCPLVICDSAHNEAGVKCAMSQLVSLEKERLHIVMGVMADKDLDNVLSLFPENAVYYFTQADTPRALNAERLQEIAKTFGLRGSVYCSVKEAYEAAINDAKRQDVVYVGGSMYVLAELFSFIDKN